MKIGLGRFFSVLTSFVSSWYFQPWPRVKEGQKWNLKVERNIWEKFFMSQHEYYNGENNTEVCLYSNKSSLFFP